MARIFFFFGWMIVGVAGALVVFGHLMLLIVYDWAYFMETIMPTTPGSNSSLLLSAATFIPGMLILGMGALAKKFERYEHEKGKSVADKLRDEVGHDYVVVKNAPTPPTTAEQARDAGPGRDVPEKDEAPTPSKG